MCCLCQWGSCLRSCSRKWNKNESKNFFFQSKIMIFSMLTQNLYNVWSLFCCLEKIDWWLNQFYYKNCGNTISGWKNIYSQKIVLKHVPLRLCMFEHLKWPTEKKNRKNPRCSKKYKTGLLELWSKKNYLMSKNGFNMFQVEFNTE